MKVKTKLEADTWVAATWNGYVQVIEDPNYEKAKGYYYNGKMRVEMSPVGSDHADDHSMITFAVNLFATLKGIPYRAKDNCTYRKAGVRECQPDISYYVREQAQVVPWGTTIIDLSKYPAPDLVIEVASTSLVDDQGAKRLLYEDLEVKEYWIIDVKSIQILAFAIANRGSRRVTESQVFPGLVLSVLEEALRRSRQGDHAQVGTWLLAQFRP